MSHIIDVNHFFLKFLLWIPVDHWVLLIRILMVGALGVIAIEEYYIFLRTHNYRRFSSSTWLYHFLLLLELFISIKFSRQVFDSPLPTHIKIGWMIIGIALVGIIIVLFIKDMRKPVKKV
jgi:phosphatidylserine synthase 2